jgi:hypothetical protein
MARSFLLGGSYLSVMEDCHVGVPTASQYRAVFNINLRHAGLRRGSFPGHRRHDSNEAARQKMTLTDCCDAKVPSTHFAG